MSRACSNYLSVRCTHLVKTLSTVKPTKFKCDAFVICPGLYSWTKSKFHPVRQDLPRPWVLGFDRGYSVVAAAQSPWYRCTVHMELPCFAKSDNGSSGHLFLSNLVLLYSQRECTPDRVPADFTFCPYCRHMYSPLH